MALPSGKVCFYRPRRTRVRVYTEKDVGRIARYAVDGGANPIRIIAYALIAAGLGIVFCKIAKHFTAIRVITRAIIKITGILAISKILEILINLLSLGLIKKIPRFNVISIAIIAIIAFFNDILVAAKQLIDDTEAVDESVSFIESICDTIDDILSGG